MLVDTSAGKMYINIVDGKGKNLLFIHGIPTNLMLWREIIPKLDGFRIAVDLIGYGKSDKPDNKDLSLTAQSFYLTEVLSSMDVNDIVCIGHDIGGGICQILAMRGIVSSMILVDSAGMDYWPTQTILRLKDPKWDDYIKRVDMLEGFYNSLRQGVVRKEKITMEVAKMYAEPFSSKEGKRAYLRAARALDFRDTLKALPELNKVKIPTLIIWGDQDVYIPYFHGIRLSNQIPSSKFILLKDIGHFVSEDDPLLLASIIKGFVDIYLISN
ncbi:hypothetical protein CM19_12580 [Candidatus Acidianus copahuensis]|uniref:AB hydrolase-1 domain-containing protein n=1 Tax=Candidatus Acidianus copahuensis TaxID=1160895 RepID=A0A031LKB2_9CREN|nr:alpha/beta hydrolase [Candidatus Acidianus copahuensis]EZQ01669.1 hypothetical protein CM19_12580 [Candidatus Acidianus copahuensis]